MSLELVSYDTNLEKTMPTEMVLKGSDPLIDDVFTKREIDAPVQNIIVTLEANGDVRSVSADETYALFERGSFETTTQAARYKCYRNICGIDEETAEPPHSHTTACYESAVLEAGDPTIEDFDSHEPEYQFYLTRGQVAQLFGGFVDQVRDELSADAAADGLEHEAMVEYGDNGDIADTDGPFDRGTEEVLAAY